MKVPASLAISKRVPLAPLVGYRIGGPARYYCRPQSVESLILSLKWANEYNLPVFLLGAGTNILVSDAGFPGLVVHLKGFKAKRDKPLPKCKWRVSAGAMLINWVRASTAKGFAGIEALAGIPGTIGGAIRMNAGAFGQEISQCLVEVEVLTPDFRYETLTKDQIGFGYRMASGLENSTILTARFLFEPGDSRVLVRHFEEFIELRRQRQPLTYPSCGSVFKRPPGDFAGRLIEAADMKGVSVGGAKVSGKHANFIINREGATAADVMKLIKFVKKQVLETSGISLEREVILLGFTKDELDGT
jgi:UDP-N-acetylmuramate dehydrogenase